MATEWRTRRIGVSRKVTQSPHVACPWKWTGEPPDSDPESSASTRFQVRMWRAHRWTARYTEIGDLGGDAWHTPMDINEQGDVVGFSNPPYVVGIDFNPLAFLWTRGKGIESLGKLVGDTSSQALGINNRRQVVGVSSGDLNRAFLWDNGVMKDF